ARMRGGFPLSVLLEYQTARTHVGVRTVAEALKGQSALSSSVDTQVIALGLHFSKLSAADLDAAITGFVKLDMPPNLASGIGFGTELPHQFGGDLMARYVF